MKRSMDTGNRDWKLMIKWVWRATALKSIALHTPNAMKWDEKTDNESSIRNRCWMVNRPNGDVTHFLLYISLLYHTSTPINFDWQSIWYVLCSTSTHLFPLTVQRGSRPCSSVIFSIVTIQHIVNHQMGKYIRRECSNTSDYMTHAHTHTH